jgi:seryl-tRNA synthetase
VISKRLFSQEYTNIIKKYKDRVSTQIISGIQILYQQVTEKQGRLDELLSQKKALSQIKSSSDTQDKQNYQTIESASLLRSEISALRKELKQQNQYLDQQLLHLPNVPDQQTPTGSTSEHNIVTQKCLNKPDFGFKPKTYWHLNQKLKLIDADRGQKLAGNRFSVLNPTGALMERALINMMLDIHTQEFKYREMGLPLLVNESALIGSGQFPKFADQVYSTNPDLSLIPTAEVPLVNLFSGEKLADKHLPDKMVAYTPCFRREAGTYGKKDKGYIRQHQFNKVELVQIVKPKNSPNTLREILKQAETIVQRLNLPYRIIELCAGELGFNAAKGYDIEVWFPGSEQYVEVSSCSNCTDFQARRANIKFKPRGSKKTRLVHTLNGSGLAVGRILLAILENFQQQDGTVLIPKALFPYMKGLTKLTIKK